MASKLANVISNVAEKVQGTVEPKIMTTASGCPIAHIKDSMTAGPHGPVLLQDNVLMEKIQHFSREKIPARNVHALGTGAYGKFTVTKGKLITCTSNND
jgi:catalase